MAYLRALGCYLPSRVVDNAEIASLVGVDPAWRLRATGIAQRRFASPEESVATLGALAAKDCLDTAAISGAAMSGATALLRSAAPSVDRRSKPSSPKR